MKFPVNGQWRVNQKTEKGVDLFGTKNITFDKRGFATLSDRVVSLFNSDDDADFGVPIAAYHDGNSIIRVVTEDEVFETDMADGLPSTTQDVPGAGDTPTPITDTGARYFNDEWVISQSQNICTFSAGASAPWTNRTLSPSLTSGKKHPIEVNLQNNTILIGNGNTVHQLDTSWVTGTNSQLTIPSGVEIVGISYNANLVGLVTWNLENREAHLFIWDAAAGATSANYAYPLGSNRAFFIVPYVQGTFVLLTGRGELLRWSTSGISKLAALPSYYTTAKLGDVNDSFDITHETSYHVDGERILFNIEGTVAQRNSEPDNQLPTQPSGVWCYDPEIGLYHRYAPSSVKVSAEAIATGDVNTTTDVITLDGTAPATGTECVYSNNGQTTLGGLTHLETYYVINVTSSTIKLATTYANAVLGTAIDLTGTGHSLQTLQFQPMWDFGQLHGVFGGVLESTGRSQQYELASDYAFGVGSIDTATLVGSDDALCVTSRFGENRGWLMTQKMFSPNFTDHWSKLIVKARNLKTANDKVVVKYRVAEDVNMPVYITEGTTTNTITWVDSTSFTTTVDLTNVAVGYEVEFIGGGGSGYLAHVVSATDNAGTWTVVIDETIKGISASDKAYCIIDNWVKTGTTMTSSSDKNGVEFPIGKQSKWLQVKIELRGKGVALEELELINKPNKVAA